MALQDIKLRETYRSDRNDLITEFFEPCLQNCVEYSRCIETISIMNLSKLALGLDHFTGKKIKMRVICGHRFDASELELLSRLFGKRRNKGFFGGSIIKDAKIAMLRSVIKDHQIEIRIAVPNNDVVGSFAERGGIFVDEQGDMVAFVGTSSDAVSHKTSNFESLDVFTSWNDSSRVQLKFDDFDDLWCNRTKYVSVYEFAQAEKNSLLKYSSQLLLDL